MDFTDRIRKLADRLIDRKPHIRSEEGTKHSLVIPFIRDLGYDIYNPAEVVPEYTADVDTKKGEKVDYAILKDGKPIFLIECKDVGVTLAREHRSQLTRYFMVTRDVRYAILTNGIIYQFFTELDEKNRMDIQPFLTIDMENLDDRHVRELERFTKDSFDADKIFSSARELRFMREIGERITAEFREPSRDFVRHFAKQVYSKTLTQARMEEFTRFVREALRQHVNDQVRSRLQSAMLPDSEEEPAPEEKAVHSDKPSIQEQTDGRPDFSVLRYWDQFVEKEELHSLFLDFVDYLLSLGNDVWVEIKQESYLVAKPKKGAFFNFCYFGPQLLKNRISIDIPGRDGYRFYIANKDDLENAKEKLQRSYVAVVERAKA